MDHQTFDDLFDGMRPGFEHEALVSRCRFTSAVLRARARDAARVVEASRQAVREARITIERARQPARTFAP